VTPCARVARALLALLAFLAIGAAAGPGVALAACPSPWHGTTTCTYQPRTGPLTVPAGVTSINITMSGGGGGGYNRGGCAGVIQGVLPTTGGEQLSVIEGGEGNANFMGPGAGGPGGGGAGGNAFYPGSPDGSGSGGGGGSFLFGPQGLIMAAGGGGGESGNGSYGGSVAGVTSTYCPWVGAGQTGSADCGAGGQPGTGSAGGQGGIVEAGCEGTGGTNGGGPATSTSSLGTGGTGGAGTLGTASSTGTGGGGGGGGYYGGGGSAGVDNTSPNDISGGGGAGSNYGNPKLLASYTVTNDFNQNAGYVDLSYTACSASSASSDRVARAAAAGCPLRVTAEAIEGRPASGLSDVNGTIEFMEHTPDPTQPPILGNIEEHTYTCMSGCTNIVVNVTDNSTPTPKAIPGATVTVSLSTTAASSPAAIVPNGDRGFICQFQQAFKICQTTATATTNNDGNAFFRYWLPGAINLDPASPDPVAVISASATSTCSCGQGTGSAQPLNVTLQPHPYINEDRPVTVQDLEGLKALIRTDTTPSQSRRDADRILKLLHDSGIIDKLAGAKGLDALLKDVQGTAESDAVDELMRKVPKLIELDWFMRQFSVPEDGLEYDTASVAAWGREIADHLAPYLADEAAAAIEGKIPGLFKKLDITKKLIKQLRDEIEAAAVAASKKVLGTSWVDQVDDVVEQLMNSKPGPTIKSKTPGTMTLKLFDVSRCTNTKLFSTPWCPLQTGYDGALFMAFSALAPGHTAAFTAYQSPNPVSYTPDIWLRVDCSKGWPGEVENLCRAISAAPPEVADPQP